MPKFNERGIAHIFLIVLLLAGLGVGVFLINKPTNLKPKAGGGTSGPKVGFSLETTTSPDTSLKAVNIVARSDNDPANLFAAKLNFPKNILEIDHIDKNTSVINRWVESFSDNNTGEVSLIGGITASGHKTTIGEPGLILATIFFKVKDTSAQTAALSFQENSEVRRQSDGINILISNENLDLRLIEPIPSPTLSPSPTPPLPSVIPSSGADSVQVTLRCQEGVAEFSAIGKVPNKGEGGYWGVVTEQLTGKTAIFGWGRTNDFYDTYKGNIPSGFGNDDRITLYSDGTPYRFKVYYEPFSETKSSFTTSPVFEKDFSLRDNCALPTDVPVVNLLTPLGGGTYKNGETISIFWNNIKGSADFYLLQYVIKGETPYHFIAEVFKPEFSYKWTLPKELAGKEIFINIQAFRNKYVTTSDKSDYFKISSEVATSPSPTPPPVACKLDSANWETPTTTGKLTTNPVKEGDAVMIRVKGNAGCNSKKLNFTVKQDNAPLPDGSVKINPSTIYMSNDLDDPTKTVGLVAWTVEFQDDGLFGLGNPPEYYFTAKIEGEENIQIKSSNPELLVNKLAQGEFPDGDGNHDGKVDLADLSLMFANWNRKGSLPPEFDLNNDDELNANDYAALLNILRQNGILKSLGSTPSPSPVQPN